MVSYGLNVAECQHVADCNGHHFNLRIVSSVMSIVIIEIARLTRERKS